jgi:ribonuclease P protein component
MIARKNRFHGLGSVRSVYRTAQTVRGEHCTLKYRDNPRRRDYRLAVVVSRKTSKSAVTRNRIRRRVYECVRLLEPEMKQQNDMVIMVYNDSFATIKSEQLQQTIKSLLQKAEIF